MPECVYISKKLELYNLPKTQNIKPKFRSDYTYGVMRG